MKNKTGPSASSETDHASIAEVDLSSLAKKFGDSREQVQRCLQLLQSEASSILKVINAKLDARDARQAKAACHGLRGVLLTMEMDRSAATASRLEIIFIEKDFETAAKLLPVLELEITRAISIIDLSIR